MASVTPRTIMHVDMDAFYAAVECVDDPALAGQAVIVGGLGPRGVVATASYEARRFGVHSAMPMARARRLCPHACFIRPRMARYREVSAGVFRIFRDYTPLVEGLSLDEAFLDISASLRLFGGPLDVARLLKQRILDETGLSASVGIAHNKFLAKLASDARKPAGLVWVRPQEVRAFLDPMPVSRLWGIGKQTAPRLRALGVLTIGQLRTADPSALEPVLGNRTGHFLELARGEDDREVTAARADKSISREVTFDEDRSAREVLLAELQQQSESVARRLRAGHLLARTVTVKIRDNRFHTVTRSRSLRVGSDSTRTLYRMARALFDGWHESHRGTPVRLLGMGVSGLEDASASGYGQGEGGDAGRGPHIDHVADDINRRFGDDKLTRAQTLRLRPPRGG